MLKKNITKANWQGICTQNLQAPYICGCAKRLPVKYFRCNKDRWTALFG